MSQNGQAAWFNIEVADHGFIGTVGVDETTGNYVSAKFVANNIGSLWLIAKEKVKELLEIEEVE